MRKRLADPPLHHPAPPFTLADPVIQFDSDLDPHWSRFRRLVDVKMLVAMDVKVAEGNAVTTARYLDRRLWAFGDGRRRIHDFR